MLGFIPIAGEDLVFFVGAAIAVLLTPGPAILYIVGVSLDRGAKAGVLSVLGINAGFLVQLVFAVAGLTLVLQNIPGALSAITLLGAAYLVYLGIDRLRKPAVFDIPHEDRKKELVRIFWDGAVVSFLNPKSALFIIAFIPQFLSPDGGPEWLQLFTLGAMFTVLGFFTDSGYAIAAGMVRRLVAHKRAFQVLQKYVAGGVFIALGVVLAVAELL